MREQDVLIQCSDYLSEFNLYVKSPIGLILLENNIQEELYWQLDYD